MKKIMKYCFVTLILFSVTIYSQSLRGLVNDGVEEYEESNFNGAEVNFKKGIENDIENFEARFNLGDAIYKQGRFEEALEEFKTSMTLAKTDYDKSAIFHNLGNTLLKSEKLKESIGAYKEALKLNPNDLETKYNLSYALKQMKDQQNDQQNQQDKDDKNQDQDKDKQDQENQDQQDKDKEEKEEQDKDKQQDQDKNQQQDKKEQQQPNEPKDEISKDEAERILDALKNNEGELQKKLRQQKGKKTNVEKDW